MKKFEYLPVGDGTVTWEEVNESLIEKINKFDIETLVERFINVKHENEKRCIVNKLCDFNENEVNDFINEFKTFAGKQDLFLISELEKMLNN